MDAAEPFVWTWQTVLSVAGLAVASLLTVVLAGTTYWVGHGGAL